ncbi:MAG: FtsW/RodA/SpoVE family cell cycle protein [Clostridia bacterium]|nr:FtsW/RodA/SpoVE family cell cycle protein [Clostridia bacterium]
MPADPSANIRKRRRKLLYTAAGFDIPFLLILLAILVIGLISLYSAGYVYSFYWNDGDSFYFIKKQLLFAAIGIAAMFAASFVDYHHWHRFAWLVWVGSIILLGVVLLLPAESGIHRWIRIPGIGQFQPSEVAKFALVLLFAHLISLNYKRIQTFTGGFLPLLLILGVTCGLVFLEPHLSGTMLLCLLGLVLMFVGGCRVRYLLGLVALGVLVVFVAIFVLGYEQERIDVWLNPLEVYNRDYTGRSQAWQTVQSLYTIGSGGLLGQGLGNSRQKHLFLPEPQNDFIFAVVCEEIGFIGALFILLLFALLIWRGFVIAMNASDKFGSIFALGLTAQIGIQVILNIAVVTNSMPNTGISLPFFSYGGTSLVMLLAQMGIVLSISRQANLKKN